MIVMQNKTYTRQLYSLIIRSETYQTFIAYSEEHYVYCLFFFFCGLYKYNKSYQFENFGYFGFFFLFYYIKLLGSAVRRKKRVRYDTDKVHFNVVTLRYKYRKKYTRPAHNSFYNRITGRGITSS